MTTKREQAAQQRQEYIQQTQQHIRAVRQRLSVICKALQERGKVHDASKLKPPELAGFARVTEQLQQVRYMSDDYRAALEAAKPTIEHHYAHNTHHPEHYEAGIQGMDLLDLMEMFCDWAAAAERMEDGSLEQSLKENMTRFGYSADLAAILENTRQRLKW